MPGRWQIVAIAVQFVSTCQWIFPLPVIWVGSRLLTVKLKEVNSLVASGQLTEPSDIRNVYNEVYRSIIQ